MKTPPCSSPCLEPCDPRRDCCCEMLGFKAEPYYTVSTIDGAGCIALETLRLTWNTPIPDCVLARAGVESVDDLVMGVSLTTPDIGSEPAPDITLTSMQIASGEITFTREELFGSGAPCGACLYDIGVQPSIVVLGGEGQYLLMCVSCPDGCETPACVGDPGGSSSECPCNVTTGYTYGWAYRRGVLTPYVDVEVNVDLNGNVPVSETCPPYPESGVVVHIQCTAVGFSSSAHSPPGGLSTNDPGWQTDQKVYYKHRFWLPSYPDPLSLTMRTSIEEYDGQNRSCRCKIDPEIIPPAP